MTRLIFLLVLVAAVAASACWITSHLLEPHPSRSRGDFHHWLHTQLDITPEQDKALEPEEARFSQERKGLIGEIQEDNAQLAAAVAHERAYTPQVQAAIEKVHHARGSLEEATLKHILAMKPILTPAQFDRLLKLTCDALNSPADL